MSESKPETASGPKSEINVLPVLPLRNIVV